MSNGKPVVLKLLQEVLTGTRSWEPHTREVLQLAIDTIVLQSAHLTMKENTIKSLKAQLDHLNAHSTDLHGQVDRLLGELRTLKKT